MRLAVSGIGTVLCSELGSASAGSFAVAYFNPNPETLSALAALPKLRLVVSDDFQINNPFKLEQLTGRGMLRVVPADASAGKLHSKVFLIRRQDGTRWAMVGSANLTGQGLFSNQEVCIILDSREPSDNYRLNDIENWFNHVLSEAQKINFALAKRIFQTRSRYRLQRPDQSAASTEDTLNAKRFWALKTTAGAYGPQHWMDFLAEDVIAIGWSDIDVDPSIVTDDELRNTVRRIYSKRDANRVVKQIRRFVDLSIGDLVLVCRGYPPNSTADVHIYGIARVTGEFIADTKSSWWKFKHKAVIQVIDQNMPQRVVARALKKDSLMETIHELSPEQFEGFAKELRNYLGVTVNV